MDLFLHADMMWKDDFKTGLFFGVSKKSFGKNSSIKMFYFSELQDLELEPLSWLPWPHSS